MRKAMIVGIMALAGFGAGGGQGAEAEGNQVTVYVQDQQVADPILFVRAKFFTSKMFAGIGVRLRWKLGGPRRAQVCKATPHAEIVMRLASRTPAGFHPGAPAYCLPYAPPSEVRITILYDRVLSATAGHRDEDASYLGHILAHEITHVLQGVARHSEAGIMKAQWTRADREQMRKGPLPFTAYDAELIQRALTNDICVDQIAAR